MLYNSLNTEVARFADKSERRPELAAVFFKKDMVVATDTFRLLEISTPANVKPEEFPDAMRGFSPFLVDARAVSKLKIPKHKTLPALEYAAIKHLDKDNATFLTVDDTLSQSTTTARVVDGTFPDYEAIFPSGAPVLEITINGKLLAELLNTLSKLNKMSSVKLKLYGTEKPIALFAENDTQRARALLMPVRE